MTWYGFQRIIEVDGELTDDNYVAVTRLHAGGHALLHPSTTALTERGGNYISAATGFTPAEQMILHYPACLWVIPTAVDRNIC